MFCDVLRTTGKGQVLSDLAHSIVVGGEALGGDGVDLSNELLFSSAECCVVFLKDAMNIGDRRCRRASRFALVPVAAAVIPVGGAFDQGFWVERCHDVSEGD